MKTTFCGLILHFNHPKVEYLYISLGAISTFQSPIQTVFSPLYCLNLQEKIFFLFLFLPKFVGEMNINKSVIGNLFTSTALG